MKLQTNPLINEEIEGAEDIKQDVEHVRSRTVSKSGSESGSDVTEGPDELSSEYDDLCDDEIAKETDFVTEVPETQTENEIGIDTPQGNVELDNDDDCERSAVKASDDVLVGPDSQSDAVKEEPEHVSQSDAPSEEKTPSSELIVTENPMAAVSAECYDVYTHETFEDDSEIESSQMVPEPIAAVIDEKVDENAQETPAVASEEQTLENDNSDEAVEVQEKNEEAEIGEKPEEPEVQPEEKVVEENLQETDTIPIESVDEKLIESQVQEKGPENTENEIDSAEQSEFLNDKVNEKESLEIDNEGSKTASNQESRADTATADYETVAEANSNNQVEVGEQTAANQVDENQDNETVEDKEQIAAIITAPDFVEGGCVSRDIGVADAESDFVVFGNNKVISDQNLVQNQELAIEPVNEVTGGDQSDYQPSVDETADVPSEPIIDAEAVTAVSDVQDGEDTCDGNDQPNGMSVEQNTIEQALEEIVIATEGAEDRPEEVIEEASVDAHSVHENNIDQKHGETIEHVNDINAEATENDISSAALDESLVGGLDHSRAYDPTIVSDASEVDDLTDDAAEGNVFIFTKECNILIDYWS